MNQPPVTISSLRCADSDRELVAGVLNKAFAEGRLTFEEHDERISKAYVAKTFGELDVLTDDLVPLQAGTGRAAMPAAVQPPSAPAYRSGPPNPHVFTGGTSVMSTLKPGGHLHLPERASMGIYLAEARIDLVDATFAAGTVEINLTVFMGEVRIRVPAGVNVVSSLGTVMAEYRADGVAPSPQGPTVHLSGSVIMGEVRVLGPHSHARKYDRFVR